MSPILAEVFGTAILIVLGDGVVANVVLQRTKGHNSGWIVITAGSALAKGFGPVLVGVIIMAIGLSLGGPTGYAINPARDLGPRIAHAVLPIDGKGSSDWGYAWIPIVAPTIGGVLGALLYHLVWK